MSTQLFTLITFYTFNNTQSNRPQHRVSCYIHRMMVQHLPRHKQDDAAYLLTYVNSALSTFVHVNSQNYASSSNQYNDMLHGTVRRSEDSFSSRLYQLTANCIIHTRNFRGGVRTPTSWRGKTDPPLYKKTKSEILLGRPHFSDQSYTTADSKTVDDHSHITCPTHSYLSNSPMTVSFEYQFLS